MWEKDFYKMGTNFYEQNMEEKNLEKQLNILNLQQY